MRHLRPSSCNHDSISANRTAVVTQGIAKQTVDWEHNSDVWGMSMAAVLTSWKEIASYMGKGVRTVQRWERELGLPIRRPKPKDKQIVLAFPDELDDWVRQQTLDPIAQVRHAPRGTHEETTRSVQSFLIGQHPLNSHREGLQRMHALLAEMARRTHVLHAQAEVLHKRLQTLQKVRATATLLSESAPGPDGHPTNGQHAN